MPLSKKASWGFVAESNRKEINTRVKWMLERRPEEEEAATMRAVLDKPCLPPDAIPRHMLPEGAVVADAPPSPSRLQEGEQRPHRHRHHRRDCPRHARREAERREAQAEAETARMAAGAREVARGNPAAALALRREADKARPMAAQPPGGPDKARPMGREERQLQALLDDRPTEILPRLYVPGVVGKGMAMFLTGAYVQDPHMYDRRPQRDHPNFQRVARVFDPATDNEFRASPSPVPQGAAGGASASPARLAATAPLAHRKLLALPVDKSRCRLKDEVKAHLEMACTSAKTMMRSKR